MTEIFDHLHGAGLNENWLVKRFESGEKTSVSELVVQKNDSNDPTAWKVKANLGTYCICFLFSSIGGAERQIINTIKWI